nr:hypothetical protein CFP56_37601 [Quercus suber]
MLRLIGSSIPENPKPTPSINRSSQITRTTTTEIPSTPLPQEPPPPWPPLDQYHAATIPQAIQRPDINRIWKK